MKTPNPKFLTAFAPYACNGDTITMQDGPVTYTATLVADDDASTPDKRMDGFWPSLDPKDAGYIGPKSKRALSIATKRAQGIMTNFEHGNWWYVGVRISASIGEIEIAPHRAHTMRRVPVGNSPPRYQGTGGPITMQSIITKYLPATNHRAARIKAKPSGGHNTVVLPYDHELDADGNHRRAAKALTFKLRWPGTWIEGSGGNTGNIYVCVEGAATFTIG